MHRQDARRKSRVHRPKNEALRRTLAGHGGGLHPRTPWRNASVRTLPQPGIRRQKVAHACRNTARMRRRLVTAAERVAQLARDRKVVTLVSAAPERAASTPPADVRSNVDKRIGQFERLLGAIRRSNVLTIGFNALLIERKSIEAWADAHREMAGGLVGLAGILFAGVVIAVRLRRDGSHGALPKGSDLAG